MTTMRSLLLITLATACAQQPRNDTLEHGVGDVDRDGDDWDKCNADAEDRDGFEDGDGCPDPDNDGDGILDEQDRCPDVGAKGFDGCPEDPSASP